MESLGIPRKAFKNAIILMAMTEDQMQAHDIGMMVLRGAMKIPVQQDLFDAA